jgi:hypothetical protein
MRSGASSAACFDASFAVSAMRARDCRWYSALSMIAPSVNVLRRTRRKPSTIRGVAPEVVIGQSTAARAGAHPYRAGELARSYHSYSDAHRVTNIFHIEMQIQEKDYQGNPFEICLNQSQAAT